MTNTVKRDIKAYKKMYIKCFFLQHHTHGVQRAMSHSSQLVVPSLCTVPPPRHSPLKCLREATAGVLWGCLRTVHVLSLLLCGASDPLGLPLFFVTNATDHITPSRVPFTQRHISREGEKERSKAKTFLGGRAAPKAMKKSLVELDLSKMSQRTNFREQHTGSLSNSA